MPAKVAPVVPLPHEHPERPRSLVNPGVRQTAVAPPSTEAAAFHAALAGYRPTPLRDLPELAAELGLDAVARAAAAAAEADTIDIADVGRSLSASRVIVGYATLFDEAGRQGDHDTIVVPVGVGSLAAAAARFAARAGVRVIGAEPVTAA